MNFSQMLKIQKLFKELNILDKLYYTAYRSFQNDNVNLFHNEAEKYALNKEIYFKFIEDEVDKRRTKIANILEDAAGVPLFLNRPDYVLNTSSTTAKNRKRPVL